MHTLIRYRVLWSSESSLFAKVPVFGLSEYNSQMYFKILSTIIGQIFCLVVKRRLLLGVWNDNQVKLNNCEDFFFKKKMVYTQSARVKETVDNCLHEVSKNSFIIFCKKS